MKNLIKNGAVLSKVEQKGIHGGIFGIVYPPDLCNAPYIANLDVVICGKTAANCGPGTTFDAERCLCCPN